MSDWRDTGRVQESQRAQEYFEARSRRQMSWLVLTAAVLLCLAIGSEVASNPLRGILIGSVFFGTFGPCILEGAFRLSGRRGLHAKWYFLAITLVGIAMVASVGLSTSDHVGKAAGWQDYALFFAVLNLPNLYMAIRTLLVERAK